MFSDVVLPGSRYPVGRPSTPWLPAGMLSRNKSAFSSKDIYTTEAAHQLLQVPAADLHVALVFVHALREALGVSLAASSAVSSRRACILAVLGSHRGVGLLLLSWLTGTAKHATDSMADG